MSVNYDSLRSAAPIWYFRIVQALLAFIILIITGNTSSDWRSFGCHTPSNVGYNIAAAVLTLPAVIYLLCSSGPKSSTHLLPWNHWGQLGLDTLLFVFWLAAAASSGYSCNGLCSACSPLGGAYYAEIGSLHCLCEDGQYVGNFLARRSVKNLLEGRANTSGVGATLKIEKLAAKQGFDALMFVNICITLGLTIYYGWQARKATSGDYATPLEATHSYEGVQDVGQEDKSFLPAASQYRVG